MTQENPNDFSRYVGMNVILREAVPGDKRGCAVGRGTPLKVSAVHGQHFDLCFPSGRLAASKVHYSKLITGASE